jgi:hypothetical protein
MTPPEGPETYTRTLRTMNEVAHAVREQPDPSGALHVLADRIDIERRWVHAMVAAGHELARPPAWFCGSPTPARSRVKKVAAG